jgi:hypothetical protein
MSKQFWAFLAVGLVVVGFFVASVWNGTKGNHLELTGKIIRVRTTALPDSTLVLVDFRVTNPSDVPLVIREVSLKLDQSKPGAKPGVNQDAKQQDLLSGTEVSRSDVDTMFDSLPSLGPKYSDVLAPGETIAPGKTIDRMAEATFEVPKSVADSRKQIILHVEDVDGAGFDIPEKQDIAKK